MEVIQMNMNEELMFEASQDLIAILNKIYTKIDRSKTEELSEVNFELVKSFNQLVDVNQRFLNILYPNRKKVKPRKLSLKYKSSNVEEVSDGN
jgi:hypothetical protein|tara:strand:- start:3912 stop:4190 length:279 start_codon:yes stop_codon:yes gene_type:complete